MGICKPPILFREHYPDDLDIFQRMTSYRTGPSFRGIVATSGPRWMGMVGMDQWTPTTAMLHWAIKHPRCIMPLWAEVCDYLLRVGRIKALGATPANNIRSLRMTQRLGWTEAYRIRSGWDIGVDMVISEYELKKGQRPFENHAEIQMRARRRGL